MTRRLLLLPLLLTSIALLGGTGIAQAAEGHWVSTNGTDAPPPAGCTKTLPCRHIAYVDEHVEWGDAVFIAEGTYTENVTLTKGGAGEEFRVNFIGTNATLKGNLTFASNHVTVSGVNVTGASGPCVTVQTSLADVWLENGSITSCGEDGILFKRPATAGAYTAAVHLTNLTVNPGGEKADHAANDLTIFGNYVTAEGLNLTGAPNDAVDMWGNHITFKGNTIHDMPERYSNHNDAWQSWTGEPGDVYRKALTNLVLERNTVSNIQGSNSHALIVEGPGYENFTIAHNVFKEVGSIGLILGVWNDTSKEKSKLTNAVVQNNAFCGAGGNAVEWNADEGSGTLKENWLIKTASDSDNVYFHTGMTVSRSGNDYSSGAKAEPEGNYGVGDNFTTVTCSEAETKALS